MRQAVGPVLVLALAAGAADKLPPPPTHPDTLPTLFKTWSLPAALTGYVRNVHAQRFALDEPRLYVFDHHGRRLEGHRQPRRRLQCLHRQLHRG